MKKNFKFLVFLVGIVFLSSCTKEQFVKQQDSTAVTDSTATPAQSAHKLIKVSNVNVEIAQEVAKVFYANVSRQNVRSIGVASVDSILDWKNRTAIYIINLHPKGYVLTSADIKNEAIIGYSEEGWLTSDTKSMPNALVANLADIIIKNRMVADGYLSKRFPSLISSNQNDWHEQYVQVKLKKYEFDDKYLDPCADSPRTLVDVNFSNPNGYLCKTSWHQDEPYNYYAPSHRYPIGCVAVAMGQIMKFHRHPWFFNWDIMPDYSENNYKNMTDGDREVARLLRDIGWMVKMDYNTAEEGGSGATIYMAWWALYYKYHYWADMPKKWDYNKIANQLKNTNRPVYARGNAERYQRGWWIFKWYTYEKGHAYIIDGIQEMTRTFQYECMGATKTSQLKDELLHYNFGWGDKKEEKDKEYNIWFSRAIIDIPDDIFDKDVITKKLFPNYQYVKECIYNIHPK